LIEDDVVARNILEGVLEAYGLTVTAVDTGDEGIELLQQGFRYELLITDIRLPGRLDGWSVAEEARRYNPRISVIYVTASHQQNSPVTGSVFLRKPIRPKLLLDIVGTLLDRSVRSKAKRSVRVPEARIGTPGYLH
jgi:CheY-like chemotaxis protein